MIVVTQQEMTIKSRLAMDDLRRQHPDDKLVYLGLDIIFVNYLVIMCINYRVDGDQEARRCHNIIMDKC